MLLATCVSIVSLGVTIIIISIIDHTLPSSIRETLASTIIIRVIVSAYEITPNCMRD